MAVLCGGLSQDGNGYRPSSFTDSDEHGMLGGYLRVLARFGPAVPAEAAVYAEHFRALAGDGPAVLLEQGSVNTVGNLAAVAALAATHGWPRLAILTSEYHLPRVRELCHRAGPGSAAGFLPAEAVVLAARPGTHDAEIAAAYASPAGLLRTASERRGLADLCAGRYDTAEQHRPGQPVPA